MPRAPKERKQERRQEQWKNTGKYACRSHNTAEIFKSLRLKVDGFAFSQSGYDSIFIVMITVAAKAKDLPADERRAPAVHGCPSQGTNVSCHALVVNQTHGI
ncbi:hypothetical protein ACVBEH_14565 [Roseateles sp. GG27B]